MFGKSGTADLPKPGGGYFKDRHTSNVIAAAPYEDPRVVVICVIGSTVLINVGRSAVEHARLSGGNMLKRHEAARIAVWTSWNVNTTPWLLGNGTCPRCPRWGLVGSVNVQATR